MNIQAHITSFSKELEELKRESVLISKAFVFESQNFARSFICHFTFQLFLGNQRQPEWHLAGWILKMDEILNPRPRFLILLWDLSTIFCSLRLFCMGGEKRGVTITDSEPLDGAPAHDPEFQMFVDKNGSDYNSSLFCHESLILSHVPRLFYPCWLVYGVGDSYWEPCPIISADAHME